MRNLIPKILGHNRKRPREIPQLFTPHM